MSDQSSVAVSRARGSPALVARLIEALRCVHAQMLLNHAVFSAAGTQEQDVPINAQA
jgi:hypothetical protein